MTKSETGSVITRNRFSISQSTHDFAILKAIKEFFNAGYLSPKEELVNSLEKALLCKDNSFYYNSTPETILPFFGRYNLLTRKYLDFIAFNEFYLLKKNKVHLTQSGLEQMKDLAATMNSGRDEKNKSRRNN